MYPWDVLGIDETGDKKAIKKAYAKLIRLYRPDEHPDKFQEINQAYEFALDQEKEKYNCIEFDDRKNLIEQEFFIKNKSVEFKLISEQIESNFKHLKSKLNDKNTWAFLSNELLKLSFQERDELAKEFFQKCFESNLNQISTAGEVLFSSSVMQYFDIQFSWSEQWSEYQQIFSYECMQLNFHLIHDSKDNLDYGHAPSNFERVKVFLIDLLIVLVIFMLLDYIFKPQDSILLFVCTYVIYQMITLVFVNVETLGSWFYQIKSVDYQFEPTTRGKKLERIFYFHCMLYPVYYLFGMNDSDSLKDEFIMGLYSLIILVCICFLRQQPIDSVTDTKVLKCN